uniref:Uncharacterized protein n=1 Tax=Arundo donax TaxID=35708 RepID=A0A0A9A7T5_ARUDO
MTRGEPTDGINPTRRPSLRHALPTLSHPTLAPPGLHHRRHPESPAGLCSALL